jgi:predicted AAA+ superfamily ATPase
MQFKRDIGDKIASLASFFPCVVVTGARQVGKTTLLRQLFPKHTYVTLDLPSLAEEAEQAPALFLERHQPPLLIDEVQYAPALFRHLKLAIDQRRHEMGRFILTGSQKFSLMKEVSDSLAGRAAIVELETLSWGEIHPSGQPTPAPDSWPERLARGFYPELWRVPDFPANDFYTSYLATYLERDVRQILNVSSLRDFERFLRACAARSAQLLSFSDLGREIGIKAETARQWIAVLQASNQVSLLEPYFENIGKRIAKTPKLYINDTGLLCFLLGIGPAALAASPLAGAVWESFVFAELRKALALRSGPSSVWYYRDAQGLEVDFLVTHGGRMDLLEAKWTEAPDRRWVDSLDKAASHLARGKLNQVDQKWILCRTPTPYPLGTARSGMPSDYLRALSSE